VHRVVNRRGIIKNDERDKKGKKDEKNRGTPEHTSEVLEKIVPLKYKDFAHHAIVLF